MGFKYKCYKMHSSRNIMGLVGNSGNGEYAGSVASRVRTELQFNAFPAVTVCFCTGVSMAYHIFRLRTLFLPMCSRQLSWWGWRESDPPTGLRAYALHLLRWCSLHRNCFEVLVGAKLHVKRSVCVYPSQRTLMAIHVPGAPKSIPLKKFANFSRTI